MRTATPYTDVLSRYPRVLLAGLLGMLALLLSTLGLRLVAAQPSPVADAGVQTSATETACPACRPLCPHGEVPSFEVWYRTPTTDAHTAVRSAHRKLHRPSPEWPATYAHHSTLCRHPHHKPQMADAHPAHARQHAPAPAAPSDTPNLPPPA